MASQPGPVFISGHQRLAATLLRTARWSVGVSALIAALALFDHYADIEALARFVPEWPAVRPASSLAILCTAAGFGLLQSSRRKSGFALLGMTALAILVALLLPHAAPLPGGPLNVYSGSVLLIIIAGTTLVHLPDRRHLIAARALAMASATLIFIAGVGISFRLILELPPLVQVSFPALLALLCLSYAIVAVRCDAWLIRLLTSPRPGAVMTRRLLPVVLLLPVMIGWIDVGAQRAGLLDYAFGAVLETVLTVVALAAVMLWGARSLDSIDVRRGEAERQALAQREWLHVTINSCGEPVVATDAAGAVRLVNPAAEVLAGQCAYDLIGRQVTEVFPLKIDDASSIEHPVMSVLSGARFADTNREFKFARDEQERYVEVTIAPIHGGDGALLGAVMTMRDVSLRRDNERALRSAYAELDRRVAERTAALGQANVALNESLALLRGVAASTPDLIMVKDELGRIVMMNPAQVKSIGKPESAILKHTEREFLEDEVLAARIEACDRKVMETGCIERSEEMVATAYGVRTYLSTRSPLRDARDRIIGVIRVATDISERKRIEIEREELLAIEQGLRRDAERANRAKDEFLAIVSHELRSPLNALRGWGFLLGSTKTPDASFIERATDAIKRNVDHQVRLIDDLLDTSRIMSGKLKIERLCVNLVDVVQAALEVVRPAAVNKRMTLDFDSHTPALMLEGDPARLQQIAVNLLSNAIKFTPDAGRVQVVLEARESMARLAVTDTGAGIDPEFLPRVFDRFSQADTSTTRRHGGLGIGLALVRHLAEMHGGTVRAYSEGVGKGSTFEVELPLTSDPIDAAVADQDMSNGPSLGGYLVWALDDDRDAREVIRLTLQKAGARVQSLASGAELLRMLDERLPEERPDVLLLDLGMPEEDGFTVLARIRALESAKNMETQSAIPAIAVSAFAEISRERVIRQGFADFVSKPYQPVELVASIVRVTRFAAPEAGLQGSVAQTLLPEPGDAR